MEAAQTLMDEIALLRRESRAYSLAEESEMGGILRRALEGMEIFASTCEIISTLLKYLYFIMVDFGDLDIASKKMRDSFESMQIRS